LAYKRVILVGFFCFELPDTNVVGSFDKELVLAGIASVVNVSSAQQLRTLINCKYFSVLRFVGGILLLGVLLSPVCLVVKHLKLVEIQIKRLIVTRIGCTWKQLANGAETLVQIGLLNPERVPKLVFFLKRFISLA
jgi:hypothetical protein